MFGTCFLRMGCAQQCRKKCNVFLALLPALLQTSAALAPQVPKGANNIVQTKRRMVYLVEGARFPGHRPPAKDGEYRRASTVFRVEDLNAKAVELASDLRNRTAGSSPFLHLVVSTACGWSQRAAIMRIAAGLCDDVSLSVVEPVRDDRFGWTFKGGREKLVMDTKENGITVEDEDEPVPRMAPISANAEVSDDSTVCRIPGHASIPSLADLYASSDPAYTGGITTPVLFDSRTGRIITNESTDILRIFAMIGASREGVVDFYPENVRNDVDQITQTVQDELNNGVYKSGLARSQSAYDKAVSKVFACLDRIEKVLSKRRYLCSDDYPTVADIQLIPTLLRFDLVYYPLFKCTKRRLKSYHNLSNYARDMYSMPGVRKTMNFRVVAHHYYTNFNSVNPSRVVSWGATDAARDWFGLPHDRAERGQLVRSDGVSKGDATEQDQTDADARRAKGEFVRGVSGHRNWIVDGKKQPKADFIAESGRYHLFVSNNCPWCHRVALGRAVLGLENHVSMDVLFYRRHVDRGWQFLPSTEDLRDYELADMSLLNGIDKTDSIGLRIKFVREVYEREGSTEQSVPILYDKKNNVIVSNESAEILRMFETVLAPVLVGKEALDLYPSHLAADIDNLNADIYQRINNGAYRSGFTSNQESHDDAFEKYFAGLEDLNHRLASCKFLLGDQLTEADLRLFPTVARHDAVYYSRMKLSKCMIADLPHLARWLRALYRFPGVAAATRLDHCRNGYFGRSGNNVVPVTPELEDEWY